MEKVESLRRHNTPERLIIQAIRSYLYINRNVFSRTSFHVSDKYINYTFVHLCVTRRFPQA